MDSSFIPFDIGMLSTSAGTSSMANQLIKASLAFNKCPFREEFPVFSLLRLFKESGFCDGCCFDPASHNLASSGYLNRIAFDWLNRFITENPNHDEIVFLCNQADSANQSLVVQAYLAIKMQARSSYPGWFVLWRNGGMFTADEVNAAQCALIMFLQSQIRSSTEQIDIEELVSGERPCTVIFKEALNMCTGGFVLCSEDGSVIEANAAARRAFEIRPHSNLQGLSWLPQIVHPDDLTALVQNWQDCSSSGLIKQKVRLFHHDGTFKEYVCTIKSVKNFKGDIINWVFKAEVFCDENKIKLAQKTLETKSGFLAEISHEIRTPLACIIGTVPLFRKTNLFPDQEELLATIQTCSHQLFNLINNVLDFTKLEANKLLLEKQNIFVEKLLQELMEIVSSDFDRKEIDFLLNIHPDTPVCLISDELRLRQVLTNLVSNAIKFTEARRSVTVRIYPIGERMLQFEVEDEGPGIPETAKLFESFVQLDTTICRRFGGSGLGLAISKKIVNLMGGSIWYESTINQFEESPGPKNGRNLFLTYSEAIGDLAEVLVSKPHSFAIGVPSLKLHNYIQLLLAPLNVKPAPLIEWIDSPTTPAILITNDSDALGKYCAAGSNFGIYLSKNESLAPILAELEESKRIAIIKRPIKPIVMIQKIQEMITSVSSNSGITELYENTAQILLRTLNTLGYTDIDTADNGSLALEAVSRCNYSLIYMDMEMPVMDGCTATAKIRSLTSGRPEPLHIVALTANAFSSDRTKCLQAGMCDFLLKPFNVKSIEQTLRQTWSLRSDICIPCQCKIKCIGPIKCV